MNQDSGRLPIKTKIAVWWISVIGVAGTIAVIVIYLVAQGPSVSISSSSLMYLSIFAAGIFYCLPALLLTLKRKTTWIAALVMLAIGTLGLSGFYFWFIPSFIIFLVPVVLVIVDAKKYLAMVEYRTAKMKTESPTDEVTPHTSDDL
jgi:cation transport ATPase